MKKMIALAACLVLSSAAIAKEHTTSDGRSFKTTDSSPAAQICMAALESREAMRVKAKELKMNRRQLKRVSCNGMSPVEFAKAHRDDMRDWSIATVQ